MRLIQILTCFVVLASAFTGGPAEAQQTAAPEAQSPLLLPGAARDPAEDMRQFIQSISTFARRVRPGFAVVVENGASLLAAQDEDDKTKLFPFRTFMRSIDGMMEDGLFHPNGLPRTEDRQALVERLAALGQDNRLKMFAIEYAEPKNATAAIERDRKEGYVPMIAPSPALNQLPTTPRRPLSENGNSVISLADVKNFAVLRDSGGFGTEAEFTLEMRNNNYDMIVVDIYHGRSPLSRQAVETLKYKKLGARRLALATMDVGRAEPFRYYWQAGWREGHPAFIKEPVKGEIDRHYVEYWSPGWQQIITGGEQSYIYGLIAQGFDGVVIRGADAYRFFDGSLEEEEAAQK